VLLGPASPSVVVVAGLPGAGKTTLVAGHPLALDSDAIRESWAPRLPPVPYKLWRPLVHARHLVAIWRALGRGDGVIVVRPFTSAWLRRAVLRRARRHHPAVHLVVVDASPAQARAGQHARGRRLSERAMRRHERRWARAELEREPWTSVTRLRRPETSSLRATMSPSTGLRGRSPDRHSRRGRRMGGSTSDRRRRSAPKGSHAVERAPPVNG
jgi:predicted kinase